MKKDNRIQILLALVAVVVSIIMFFGINNKVRTVDLNKKIVVDSIYEKPIKKKSNKLTDKEVLDYITSLNIRFPKVVLAQAKLESGNYTSYVFKTKKNLFGMKLARSRPTTANKNSIGYASYSSWKQSVIDYALLQTSYYRNCRTEQQYLEQLQRSYCENNKYIQHLKELMK